MTLGHKVLIGVIIGIAFGISDIPQPLGAILAGLITFTLLWIAD